MASTLKGRTIMWVEDDPFLSDVIAKKLGGEECAMLHASSGEQALVMLETAKPDLLLLDIVLPGMDGYEVLERIKQSEKTKNIPVIMLSNLGQRSDVEKAKQLGAIRFFIKAMSSLDEVIEEIKTVLLGSKE